MSQNRLSEEKPSGVLGTSGATTGAFAAHLVRAGIIFRSILSTGRGRFALSVVLIWLICAFVSLFWTPQPLLATDGYNVWQAPSAAHWLGTDGVGADVFSWLFSGASTELILVLATGCLTFIVGVFFTRLMCAKSSLVSSAATVAIDALISVPTVLLVLILVVPLGASLTVIVMACGFGYGLNLARVARPQALLYANSDFVIAARVSGSSRMRCFFLHVLPNLQAVFLVQMTLSLGTCILAEAGLTYLGIGVPSGVASWGHSLATSVPLISVYPLAALWPGLIVSTVVLSLNLLGDALRDALDPLVNTKLRETYPLSISQEVHRGHTS